MNFIKSVMLFALASVMLFSCKPKDADIKTEVEKKLTSIELTATAVDVKEGVVTVGGQAKDDAGKLAAETVSKEVKGVKSVVNNVTVAAPVVIATDDVLTQSVKDAVKDYPTVVANVNAGVVSLTGNITKDGLRNLMMVLSTLKPKKIDNKLTVK
ncbi:MAG: BON domain-containing protein [Pedobacter sp.]|nr:MAG: BON domain-containing protein [Pedobacter sp.]